MALRVISQYSPELIAVGYLYSGTADNTAYTRRANALALRDIAPFGRKVGYAGNVIHNSALK